MNKSYYNLFIYNIKKQKPDTFKTTKNLTHEELR